MLSGALSLARWRPEFSEVLTKDDDTGAIDAVFDPRNSQVIFADMWARWKSA
jgi:hypothetical protein